jgi:hypothetical protein
VQTAGEVLLYGAEVGADSIVLRPQGTLSTCKPGFEILKVEQGQVFYREDGVFTALRIAIEEAKMYGGVADKTEDASLRGEGSQQ